VKEKLKQELATPAKIDAATGVAKRSLKKNPKAGNKKTAVSTVAKDTQKTRFNKLFSTP
jgi:hypothetical protein